MKERKRQEETHSTLRLQGLGALVDRFHNLYRDRPLKRCVHAAAELFVYLADRGYNVTAVRTQVLVGKPAGKIWFEHSWVETELGSITYVLDVTGPQQFGFEGAVHPKKEYLAMLEAGKDIGLVTLKEEER